MSELPTGWAYVPLTNLAEKLVDGSHNPPTKSEHGLPMLSARNIKDHQIAFDEFRFIEPFAFEIENRRTNITPGDVLLTIVGAIGRTAVVPQGMPKFTLQRSVAVIGPNNAVDANFLSYVFESPKLQAWLNDNAKGTAQRGIYLKSLGAAQIPLPPLPEQHRIVARIESLFSRARRARAELARIASLARQYREACTESAFSGREAAGWPRVALGKIADIKSGITLGKKYAPGTDLVERPYLRVANVQRGHLRLNQIKLIRLPPRDAERLKLESGDVLMNEGGDRDKLGRGWIWQGEVAGCVHQNHVFRVRLKPGSISPAFLSRYTNHFGQRYFLDEGKQTTNLASISMSKVAAIPVPIPPATSVASIDKRLTTAEATEKTVEYEVSGALVLLDRLERSILKRAFRGELVPQDPNDEPASVVLDRIRSERASAAAAKPKHKAKK